MFFTIFPSARMFLFVVLSCLILKIPSLSIQLLIVAAILALFGLKQNWLGGVLFLVLLGGLGLSFQQMNKGFEVVKVELDQPNKQRLLVRHNNQFFMFFTRFKEGAVQNGDRLTFERGLQSIPVCLDSATFCYWDYLRDRQISGVWFQKKKGLQIVGERFWLEQQISRVKHYAKQRIVGLELLNKASTGLWFALIFGDKSLLSQEQKTAFFDGGIGHVLAISGLHVSLMFFSLTTILPFQKKWWMKLWISLLLAGYIVLAGCPVSGLRALLMCLLFIWRPRNIDPIQILFAVGAVILAFELNYLWDVGFQLSFVATAGILFYARKVEGGLRNIFSKKISGLLAVNIVAFFSTLPVLVLHFGKVNISGLFLSVAVVPLISILMYAGLVGVVVLPFSKPYFEWLWILINGAFTIFDQIVKLLVGTFGAKYWFVSQVDLIILCLIFVAYRRKRLIQLFFR